ncbi:MAG: monomethylamine:corrinoid methyltransferase [Saccharolobus sp.]|uniref:monomethylamine:corrinoid methyltransferase n=1 Tax=Saccharolobus sp. TaxID=2100761 RepID=UPI00317752E7
MVPPYKIDELIEKAEQGPIMTEKDFDLKIFVPTLKRVIKEYDITYDEDEIIPTDDSIIKDAFKAAIDFYLNVGTFCTSSSRRILFTEEEIKEALSLLPGEFEVGYGKDKRKMKARKIEDETLPFFLYGPMGQACSEDIFTQVIMAYMKDPLADGVSTPSLDKINNVPIKVRGPSEIAGAVTHSMIVKQAARMVGRPGIFTVSVATAPTDAAQIAASHPQWGKWITDAGFVGSLAELKVDYDLLRKMLHFHYYGQFIGALTGPLLGGLCGGPEGTAIVAIAYHLQGILVQQAHFQASFPMHIFHSCTTTRECLWALHLSTQSIAMNTPIITFAKGKAAAGPCTEMVLYEAAAHGLLSVSGANLYVMGAARNKYKDTYSPLEARMASEVAYAVTKSKIKRNDANIILKEILKKYEKLIPNAPAGKKIQECYDIKRLKPSNEYIEIYKRVKKDLMDMGIDFPF